jgi:polar amino acid transport system ATP-binding protein
MARIPSQDDVVSTASDAAIEVRALHKSFGALEVLKGIDFHVDKGEVVCVIGPSGSGKSTLLRCINLLETPTSGKIWVSGQDVTDPDVDIDSVRRRIGMVFQQFNLFPHLSVLENLTIAQRRYCVEARPEARTRGARPTSSGSGWATRRRPTRHSCRAARPNAPAIARLAVDGA